MSKALLARRDALIERHKVLESVPGSGFHDDDKFEGKLFSPQAKGLPRISTHLVPFYSERQVKFVGDDAVEALGLLNNYAKAKTPANPKQIVELTGTEKKLLVEIPKQALTEVDGVKQLVLWRDTWNDFVHAFYASGAGLSGLPEDDASKPA